MASCSINCVFLIRVFPNFFPVFLFCFRSRRGQWTQQHVSGDVALEWHDCNAITCPFIYSYSILQRRICRLLLQKSNMLEFILHFIFDVDCDGGLCNEYDALGPTSTASHSDLSSQQSHASDFLVLSCWICVSIEEEWAMRGACAFHKIEQRRAYHFEYFIRWVDGEAASGRRKYVKCFCDILMVVRLSEFHACIANKTKRNGKRARQIDRLLFYRALLISLETMKHQPLGWRSHFPLYLCPTTELAVPGKMMKMNFRFLPSINKRHKYTARNFRNLMCHHHHVRIS